MRALIVVSLVCALAAGCAGRQNEPAARARVDLASLDGTVHLGGPRAAASTQSRRGFAPTGRPATGGGRLWSGPGARASGPSRSVMRAGEIANAQQASGTAPAQRGRTARSREPGATARSAPPPASARTLRDAFSAAYDANPTINQARAGLRAADEDIAIARSGNRPTLTAGVAAGGLYSRGSNVRTARGALDLDETRTPGEASLTVSQPLFQGFRTRNSIRQAEANVRAERERLSATQQDVLLSTAIAFLDVRRFRRGVEIRRQDVDFLAGQVRAARSRREFGEGTRTDVAQAEARLEEARSVLAQEIDAAEVAAAQFRELTGLDPATLRQDLDLGALLPATLSAAMGLSQDANPDIKRALHEVDEASFNVKTLQGEALPTVTLSGTLQSELDASGADRQDVAQVRLGVEIPIYQGGRVSARVRRAKEELGGARLAVDATRDSVRASLVSAWSNYRSALVAREAAQASVRAAREAVDGTLSELRVGQRTTVDVLDAQSDLLRARLRVAIAERDRDAAAFAILRATGGLRIDVLGLPVAPYEPGEHYAAVRDKWSGMRTPDGR